MMGSRRKGGRRDDPAPPLSEDSMLRASAHERERTAEGERCRRASSGREAHPRSRHRASRARSRRPRPRSRPHRLPRSAARDDGEGDPPRPAPALQGLLRRDVGGPERRLPVLASRRRRLRRRLRPSPRHRPCRGAQALPQAETGGRRHLSAAAAGGGGSVPSASTPRASTRSGPSSSGIRACAFSNSAAPAC